MDFIIKNILDKCTLSPMLVNVEYVMVKITIWYYSDFKKLRLLKLIFIIFKYVKYFIIWFNKNTFIRR